MRKYNFFVLSIVLLLLAVLFESLIDIKYLGKKEIQSFQKTLLKKETSLSTSISSISEKEIFKSEGNYYLEDKREHDILKHSGENIFIYKNDTLIFWSDNSAAIPQFYHEIDTSSKCLLLGNSWYFPIIKEIGEYNILGLILIKNSYSYENQFLKNNFQSDFSLTSTINLSKEKVKNSKEIYNSLHQYLFSLVLPDNIKESIHGSIYILFLYLLALIFLLIFLHQFISNIDFLTRRWKIFLSLVLLFIIRFVMISFNIPDVLYSVSLFSPKYFAVSSLLPSLGDLLINSLFFLFIIYEFFIHFTFPVKEEHELTFTQIFKYTLLIVAVILYYLYINFVLGSLIFNSSISFEAYRVSDLSLFSFVGFFIIGIQFISLIFLLEKTYKLISNGLRFINVFLWIFIISSLAFILQSLILQSFDIKSIVLFYFLTYVVLLIHYKNQKIYQFPSITVLVLLLAFYSVYFINVNTEEKEKSERRTLAVSLATEHDPTAEIFLPNMENHLRNDSVLYRLIFADDIDFDALNSYMKKKYFSGFWNKYDFQLVICSPLDSIYIEPPDDIYMHCYSFFDSMVGRDGIQIEGSNFYFLDNLNGRISYFGSIDFLKDVNSLPVTLFIDINSKLFSKELGFPELLLDEKYSRKTTLDKYSYAKYNSSNLISQNGSFQYKLSLKNYPTDSLSEFHYLSFDNYDHLIYTIDKNNTIIISKASTSYLDVLISLSYIFLFFYILSSVLILFSKSGKNFNLNLSFKDRIQAAMLFILLLSLFVVGGGTIYFSIQQYKNTHNSIIAEKIQSVYIELENVLKNEDNLSLEWKNEDDDNLNELLIKLSNIFYTDINLFNNKGDLIASSRPEIYKQGIIGRKMNFEAFRELAINKKTEFIHKENIGKLNYLSGYVPFINKDNKFLAYLNLPYFTKQNLFKRDISTLVITIVNIYVLLLIMALGISFIISNKLTLPLKLIQNMISKLDIGKSYEKIEYERKDEIGSLVAEYNNKVDELQKSVELLAKSERESAWKEMAKQIAHEIKNPLTPIKLSVQHLNKAWKDKKENWDSYLENFTNKMIVQIDNLSTIATEFSNFAKMPDAKNKKVTINDIITDAISLFENTLKTKIELDITNQKSFIFADREQLSRALINLIKNAIQSIPENKKGIIKVTLKTTKDTAIIEIIDNGSGIPEELRDKLFQPNFTTKSGGMGLGLAIVKKTIEDCFGNIYFESEVNKSTRFVVEIPLMQGAL